MDKPNSQSPYTLGNYTPHAALPIDERRRRLVFRAWHRGIKEMDLIFGNFVEKHISTMSDDDCTWFETLFEENDHEILAWVTSKSEPPVAFQGTWMDMLQKLDFMTLKAK